MIYYPIQTLVKAGIKEILVIVSGPYAGHFIRVLKNGDQFGLDHLEYAYQERADGGIADALSLAEHFASQEPITVILGDNTTDADISSTVNSFTSGAYVFLSQVSDPQRFGVPEFNQKKQIVRILEKPKHPPSNYAVTGLYIYDHHLFGYIKQCRPSKRGELEITDVNNYYIQAGQLNWAELAGYWLDAGTFDTLLTANVYWAKKSH